ncbi:MAG: MMPL family transporter [Polyangiaceae bacterium]
MLERFCRFILRHRAATLFVSGAILAASIAMLFTGGRLTSGHFREIESDRAESAVTEITGYASDATFLAVFRGLPPGEAGEAIVDAAVEPVRSAPDVARVVTPHEAMPEQAARMVNDEAGVRVALVTMKGDPDDALARYPAVRAALGASGADVIATGHLPFIHDMNVTLEHDLARAELIALPLALLVLLIVFRTVVSAALPLGVGAIAVVGGIACVFALSHGMDIAMYTINVCSLIGLGVSIDYSLFLLSRYREELGRGLPKNDAIVKAVSTAGKTIAFSGVAVCTGLGGLMFFTGSYLFTMGIGGAIVVALAVVFALTFLPALLSVLGPWVHALALPFAKRGAAPRRPPVIERSAWSRIARGVMKHPILVGLPTLAALLAMGVSFLHLRLAAADVRVLDRKVEARAAYEELRGALPDLVRGEILVAVRFPGSPLADDARVEALVDLGDRVRALPNVKSVSTLFAPNPLADRAALGAFLREPPPMAAVLVEQGKAATVGANVAILRATTDATSDSEEARAIVRAIREDRRVADGELTVGGGAASDIDTTRSIVERLPYAVAFVISATLVLLFLLLRSVLLPLKAIVMNILSMAGSFGALVFIFQDGHFGVREPRPLEPTLPVLLFCVLFGLSMDYEVLLLSRIRESWLRTGDNTRAVAEGVGRTAGLITSAAAIMVAVFVAFAFADVVMIQAVGVGMALAVFLDATLVRTLLVPATMRLVGDLNWWSPFGRGPRAPKPPPSAPPERPERVLLPSHP